MAQGNYKGAVKCFEVACPLMEILPYSSMRKTKDEIALCFDYLKSSHTNLSDVIVEHRYQDLLNSIRAPYQRLAFEFKYKENMKNISFSSPELEGSLKIFVENFAGPSSLLLSFLETDILEKWLTVDEVCVCVSCRCCDFQ